MTGARSKFFCLGSMTDSKLSPAAQAVDRAIAARIYLLGEIAPSRQVAAAALRAAANQDPPYELTTGEYDEGWGEAMATVIAIATELEALPYG